VSIMQLGTRVIVLEDIAACSWRRVDGIALGYWFCDPDRVLNDGGTSY